MKYHSGRLLKIVNSKGNINNMASFVNAFLSDLGDRQKSVIKGRYGLDGGEASTLQAIGDRYGITRERIRQIEASALEILKKQLTDPFAKSFIQTGVNRLKSLGGAEKEDSLIENLCRLTGDRTQPAVFANAAKFLLELSGKVSVHRDNQDTHWHTHWFLSDADKKRAHGFVTKFISALNDKKNEILAQKKFGDVLVAVTKAHKLTDQIANNYLAISKKFAVNSFNEFGLVDWPEINPRTARDWAYVILKKGGKPLHFSEISKMVSQYRKGKRTNLQTIHNELIKDNRFVLVGRGIYGLSEHGLIPGTAREFIAHLLKKHGPLSSREVINLVMQQRMLKEGTILINLQNRKHFTCMPDGKYCVREA